MPAQPAVSPVDEIDRENVASVNDPLVAIAEYAKAVLFNGVCHYQAARIAAHAASQDDSFHLLDWALAELVEASVRTNAHHTAVQALARLEHRAERDHCDWLAGLAAYCRGLEEEGVGAEAHYAEAVERLARAEAHVAVGRAELVYGEWLRRRGRRVDARGHLANADAILRAHGMTAFAQRARREMLATAETARKRDDSTRLELTPQESQIAQLASSGYTNAEIGERLFISARTVEWHLRKVFPKLGIRSRRELRRALPASRCDDPAL